MPTFSRVLIVVNPVSTNAAKARRHIQALQRHFKVTIAETSDKGLAPSADLLYEHRHVLGPDTLLAIAAGDGTVSTVVQALMTDDRLPAKARKTIILPLWGGNANDLGYMLNGLSSQTSMDQIIAEGQVVPIHPLKFNFEHDGEQTSRLALCYASFGASAYAARRINRPAHRRKHSQASLPVRLVVELAAVISAYIEAPTFRMAQDGRSTTMYEYLLVNGSRLAKVDRVPIKLSDKAYYHAVVRRKRPSILWYMYQAIRRQNYGKVISHDQEFESLQDLPAQCDGEVFTIAKHTIVQVGLSEQPFYALSTKLPGNGDEDEAADQPAATNGKPVQRWRRFWMKLLIVFGGILGYFHVTNPYAEVHIVKNPYTTSLKNGQIIYHQNFRLRVRSGRLWSLVGYYKSGFLIVQNRYAGGHKAPSTSSEAIISDIHHVRFDPAKPYLISGDQFSVLYVRNLGVFYNSLLNPLTARSKADWSNRQRIYLQSVLYGLDGLTQSRRIPTTLVPIGPRQTIATQVHPGSISSDSVYGLLYALHALLTPRQGYPKDYRLQTTSSAQRILTERHDDLKQLVERYQTEVQDPTNGLIQAGLKLAAARDGVTRDRSFYDNVVLWKTLQLADNMGIIDYGKAKLRQMRTELIALYWDDKTGHFKDSLGAEPDSDNYGSDWLIVLPTGFLDSQHAADLKMMRRSIDYTRQHNIAEPFPIKYQAGSEAEAAPWAVRTFVPNYGSTAIWSYWGAEYIKLLALAYQATKDTSYKADVERYIKVYRQKIEQYKGFPESFDAQGNFLKNPVYQSIRQTGWVVAFEDAIVTLKEKP